MCNEVGGGVKFGYPATNSFTTAASHTAPGLKLCSHSVAHFQDRILSAFVLDQPSAATIVVTSGYLVCALA